MVPFTSSHSGGKQQGTFTANTDISEGNVTIYVFIFLSLYTPALPRRLCFHLCLFACLFVYWSVSRITQKWLNSTKLGWRTGLSPEQTPWIFGAALDKGMDLNNFSRKYAWILVDPCIEPGYYFECSTDRIILTKPNTTTFTTKHSNFFHSQLLNAIWQRQQVTRNDSLYDFQTTWQLERKQKSLIPLPQKAGSQNISGVKNKLCWILWLNVITMARLKVCSQHLADVPGTDYKLISCVSSLWLSVINIDIKM